MDYYTLSYFKQLKTQSSMDQSSENSAEILIFAPFILLAFLYIFGTLNQKYSS